VDVECITFLKAREARCSNCISILVVEPSVVHVLGKGHEKVRLGVIPFFTEEVLGEVWFALS
jgi:hypothetical protein